MKKKYIAIGFLVTVLLQNLVHAKPYNLLEFSASEEQDFLIDEIIESLKSNHFIKKDYVSIRDEAFKLYLERLDPNKTIFLSEEKILFEEKVKKSDVIKDGLKQAFIVFMLYRERYLERHAYQIMLLEKISDEDLKSNLTILRDRSKASSIDSKLDLKMLWKNLIINDIIQLRLSSNSLEESISKIKKRLNNQLNYFNQTDNEDIFDIYVNSLSSIYGPHTAYMSPKSTEDFDINMSLSLEGIGALLTSDGLYTSISSLIAGGPAEKSGVLKPNDKIIGVGQDDSDEMVDVIGWRIDDVVQLIRGPKDSIVKLEIIPENSLDDTNTKKIEIVRSLVKLEDQAAEKKLLSVKRDNKDYKIGVIELPAFYFDFEAYQKRDYSYRSSSKDVKKLINELKNEEVDGLILDLRNNGGGSLFEANALAHLFLGRGTTVQVKDAKGNIQGLGERWGYPFYDKPLLLLVNKLSASASEILAGAVQDYDRGIIVGTDTFGKGTVQRVDTLSLGQIKYTESKFYRVSGSSTQNRGVLPDITLPSLFNIEEIGENKLDRALVHDTIPSINYRNRSRVNSFIGELQERSQKRITGSLLFQDLKEKKKWQKDNKLIYLELDYDLRLENKTKNEESILSMENKLRSQLDLPIFENYQDFLDRDEDPDILDVDLNILNEASEILTDLIDLKNKPLIASNKGKI